MSNPVPAALDEDAFTRLVEPHRRELLVHAYRLLGSSGDAEDALQEALLAAWRGLAGLRDREALRPWLYRITTNAALRLAERRGPRMLSWDRAPSADPRRELGAPAEGPVWIEPFHDRSLDPSGSGTGRSADPLEAVLRREHIELAWIAALQHLPAAQRAALVLKEVLGFSAAEIAEILETSPAAVNSSLQRARARLAERSPTLESTSAGPDDEAIVEDFVAAFERGDVDGLVRLLAAEVRFTMPPLPAWFDGVEDVTVFLAEQVFATPWRARRVGEVNGHPAVFGEQRWGEEWRPGALMILHLVGGRIGWLATFVDPAVKEPWSEESAAER